MLKDLLRSNFSPRLKTYFCEVVSTSHDPKLGVRAQNKTGNLIWSKLAQLSDMSMIQKSGIISRLVSLVLLSAVFLSGHLRKLQGL